MKIIDKHKDYYDYLQGVYGQDPLAVYDRRGSTFFNRETAPLPLRPIPASEKKGLIGVIYVLCGFVCYRIYFENLPGQKITFEEFETYRLASRETGIPIRVRFDYLEYVPGQIKTHLRWTRDSEKNGFPIGYPNGYLCHEDEFFSDGVDRWFSKRRASFSNPILMSMPLMVVPAEQVFEQVHEFLLSLNDKPIVDSRTDEQKLESAGFDKKTSFRKM